MGIIYLVMGKGLPVVLVNYLEMRYYLFNLVYNLSGKLMALLRRTKNKRTDMNRFLSELNESFSIISDLEQLKDNFSARLKVIFDTKDISIFLFNPDLNRFLPVDRLSNPGRNPDIPYFLNSDKLIFWFP